MGESCMEAEVSHLSASSAKSSIEVHSHHLFHVEWLEIAKVCPKRFRILALIQELHSVLSVLGHGFCMASQ